MDPIMVFTDTLVEIPPNIQIREAVRAVSFREGKMLLMYSKQDQMYGTPGGGITLDESKLDTLYRELLEEAGASQVRIIEHLGYTEEIRESRSLLKPLIILSDYYHVEIPHFIESNLEEHEEEMGLEPMWVSVDEAIRQNESVLAGQKEDKLTFYHTQTEMLKYIRNRFGL